MGYNRRLTLKDQALHKFLNKRQTELRQKLTEGADHHQAVEFLLSQHAMLHSRQMAKTEPWSLEDDVLDDMTEKQIRTLPDNVEHTVAWCLWHIARCEDITMNLLVAGSEQVLRRNDYSARLKISIVHSGNAMSHAEIAAFSQQVDTKALYEYRIAVGCRTREIILGLDEHALKQKVDPARLQLVRDEGAVLEAASGVIEYWGKRDVAGLMLMPATRHCLTHLNEALQLKHRLR